MPHYCIFGSRICNFFMVLMAFGESKYEMMVLVDLVHINHFFQVCFSMTVIKNHRKCTKRTIIINNIERTKLEWANQLLANERGRSFWFCWKRPEYSTVTKIMYTCILIKTCIIVHMLYSASRVIKQQFGEPTPEPRT